MGLCLISSMSQAASGRLQINIFAHNLPIAGIKVFIPENFSGQTDENGAVSLGLFSGDHEVELRLPNGKTDKRKVKIIDQEQTTVIVTLSDGEFAWNIEVPKEELKAKSNKITDHTKTFEVAGEITHELTGQPIPSAQVYNSQLSIAVVTDHKGRYKIHLPVGSHQLSVMHSQFEPKTLREINVSNQPIEQNIKLTPAGLQLDEIVVLAPHIQGSVAAFMDLRRSSESVADVIGADQISKSGDSDAASSLKRVTGLTLMKGKYIYVRGLGERYSSTLLNGSHIPSPEPNRRVVPLDMFPAKILEGMVIQKGYSADMPGEFGGGTIQIQTKSLPDKLIASASMGSGFAEGYNPSVMKTYQGGSKDWLGQDDGTRSLPKSVQEATKNRRELRENNDFYKDGFTAEQLAQLGREMPNIYNTKSLDESNKPSIWLSLGNKWQFSGVKFGALGAGLFSNSWDYKESERHSYNNDGDDMVLKDTYEVEATQNTIKLGGNLDLGVEIGKNQLIGYTGILVRKTSDTVQIREGINAEQDQVKTTDLEWLERELKSHQLHGKHAWGADKDFKFKWHASTSTAEQLEPDHRIYKYYLNEGQYELWDREDSNERLYGNLVDEAVDVGVNMTIPVPLAKTFKPEISFGVNQINKSRVSEIRRFRLNDRRPPDKIKPGQTQGDLEKVLGPDRISPDGFVLKEGTLPTDNYLGEQKIESSYASVKVPVLNELTLTAGLRQERSIQKVRTFNLFDDETMNEAYLETIDKLPAYSATWMFLPKMQLRFGYSETLNRPDFRELSTAPYSDPETGKVIIGNENLIASVITSRDLRWEYYPSTDESLSLGIFNKEFKSPIESIIEPGSEGRRTYQNAQEAQNYGAELEVRKNLRFLSRKLKDLTFVGNYSKIISEITLDQTNKGVLTSTERPLQGQSPYVANVQFFYETKKTTVGLLYNLVGERIVDVGTQGSPDVYEQPYQRLDLVMSRKMTKQSKVSFKANNLLDDKIELRQGDKITEAYARGRDFSVSYGYTF